MADDLDRAELRLLVQNLGPDNWFGCLARIGTILVSLGYLEAAEIAASVGDECDPDLRQYVSDSLRRDVERYLYPCDSN
jgi:hypothetical protein